MGGHRDRHPFGDFVVGSDAVGGAMVEQPASESFGGIERFAFLCDGTPAAFQPAAVLRGGDGPGRVVPDAQILALLDDANRVACRSARPASARHQATPAARAASSADNDGRTVTLSGSVTAWGAEPIVAMNASTLGPCQRGPRTPGSRIAAGNPGMRDAGVGSAVRRYAPRSDESHRRPIGGAGRSVSFSMYDHRVDVPHGVSRTPGNGICGPNRPFWGVFSDHSNAVTRGFVHIRKNPHDLRRHQRDPAAGHLSGNIRPAYRVILPLGASAPC